MEFTTHNDGPIQVVGSLKGHITVKYEDLVRVFGNPHNWETEKSDAEWKVEFLEDDTYIRGTIYNYKNGKNYCGDDGTPTEEITGWNIGGELGGVVELIRQALNEEV